jgi:uncharacterized protein (UPF0332 family)
VKEFTRSRLGKAAEALDAARLLLEEGFEDAAADRAYYAMFYAAEALLAEHDLAYSSHGAVHGAFGRLFAKAGKLDRELHGWFIQAFEARQLATYGADASAASDVARVRIRIDRAEEFVRTIREFLNAP